MQNVEKLKRKKQKQIRNLRKFTRNWRKKQWNIQEAQKIEEEWTRNPDCGKIEEKKSQKT